MTDARRGLTLTHEALADVVEVRVALVQHLDRCGAAQILVPGLVNCPHAALAQQAHQHVPPEDSADARVRARGGNGRSHGATVSEVDLGLSMQNILRRAGQRFPRCMPQKKPKKLVVSPTT